MLPNGTAVKRRTPIDIPLEIGLPHFISDDDMSDNGPAFGNFKLSLQSVVCHQGLSVESGHYISFVRSPDPENEGEDRWMRFDDLARERVIHIDIEEQLRGESPYLLFYQVMPIEGEPDLNGGVPINGGELPPSYADSTGSKGSKVDSGVGDVTSDMKTGEDVNTPARGLSIDASISEEGNRGRSSMTSNGQRSMIFSDTSNASSYTSGPSITVDSVDRSTDRSVASSGANLTIQKDGASALIAPRSDSKSAKAGSKSRPSSQGGEGRISTSLSRLANRISRDKLTGAAIPQPQYTQTEKPTGANTAARASLEIGANSRNPSAAEVPKAQQDRARLKKEAREKTKNLEAQQQQQQQQHHLLTKGRKPDRECVLM
ncbi:MAG: hypothetical protein Q9163_001449 [Psora crenata]